MGAMQVQTTLRPRHMDSRVAGDSTDSQEGTPGPEQAASAGGPKSVPVTRPRYHEPTQAANASLMGESEGARKKRWAHRVRTGCTTCRTRRIKCDESQPTCRRCAVSKRECQWPLRRPNEVAALAAASQVANVIKQPSIPVSPVQVPHRQHEVHLFHYFRTEVAPQLAGEFDQGFWSKYLLCNAQTQPVLWYACNAIAATHLLQRSGHAPLQPDGSNHPRDALPLQPYYQYQTALQRMRDLISSDTVADQVKFDIILASQLFVILSMLRGDVAETASHYHHTCMLIGLWRTWAETRIHRRLDKYTIQTSDSLVYVCMRTNSLILYMVNTKYLSHSYWEGCSLRLRDDPFISLTEAYFELEPFYDNVTQCCVHPGPEDPQYISYPYFITELYDHYDARLVKWEGKWAELVPRCNEPGDELRISVLNLRVSLVKLLLRYRVLQPTELYWDDCTDVISALVDECKKVIELRYASSRRRMALEDTNSIWEKGGQQGLAVAITPMSNDTLYTIIRLCRDPVVRRRACALLLHDFYLTPSIHTLLFIHMADVQIRLEEARWQDQSATPSDDEASETPACECSREHSYICDGHRIFQTCIDDMSSAGAVFYYRTVEDFRTANLLWRTLRMNFTLHRPELEPLADI